MKNSINFDLVADIYDYYVNVDFDIPFYLNETKDFNEEILELMCGTGRSFYSPIKNREES